MKHLLSSSRTTNNCLISSIEFIRCFHQFIPRIFTTKLSQFELVWAVEKENKLLIGPKQFFSQFASWKRKNNKYSLKNFVDMEFEIGETIWWIRYRPRQQKDCYFQISAFCVDDHLLCVARYNGQIQMYSIEDDGRQQLLWVQGYIYSRFYRKVASRSKSWLVTCPGY